MNRKLVGIALIVAACSDPTAASSNITFSVVQQMATQDPNVTTIEFLVTNTGNETVYLAHCGENVLTNVEQRRNGEWILASGEICPLMDAMGPVELEPAMQITGIRQVVGKGQFRLRTSVSSDPAASPQEKAFSSPFVID